MKKLFLTTTVTSLFLIWAADAAATPVVLQNATATFSQSGWTVDQTIDGLTSGGGWAFAPNVSTSHIGVWETAADLGSSNLTFSLIMRNSGLDGVNLSRLRFSATQDARSTFADGLVNGGDVTATWTQLAPLTALAAGAGAPTINGDNSITFAPDSTTNNISDITYTVTANTPFGAITGFRLEVFANPRVGFIMSGNTTGNAVLTELMIDAVTSQNWTGGTGDWTIAGNWANTSVPIASSVTLVDNSGTAQVTTAGQVSSTLSVANSGSTVDIQSGGQLTLGGSASIGSGAALSVSGALTVPTLNTAGTTQLQSGSTGSITTLNVTGGTTTVASNTVGTANVSGGALHVSGSVPTLNVNTGGTANLNSGAAITTLHANSGANVVVTGPASATTVNGTGGSVSLTGGNLSVGSMTLAGALVDTGAHSVVVSSQLDIGTMSYAVTGGTFQASSAQLHNDSAPRTLTLSGGTLSVSAPDVFSNQSFTTVGTTSWTAPSGVSSVEYLVVGGGGGGGGFTGAGGGAGGFRTGTTSVTPLDSYTVTVGAGGAGGVSTKGANGGNSVFDTIISLGGGAGGSNNPITALHGVAGGSGGGSSYGSSAGTPGAGTAGQGNAGGNVGLWSDNYPAGGGGGAGAVGGNGINGSGGHGGHGGAGLASDITGTLTYYAGGGGGGAFLTTPGGNGGLGGGGHGGTAGGVGTTSGAANTGGGGGGQGGNSTAAAGSGGSGIVALRWSLPGAINLPNTHLAVEGSTVLNLLTTDNVTLGDILFSEVSALLTLTGGMPSFDFGDLYVNDLTPTAGTHQLLAYSAGLLAPEDFDNVFVTLPGGWSYTTQHQTTGYFIELSEAANAIPEPGTYALGLIGLVGVALVVRRNHRKSAGRVQEQVGREVG